jgi:hypothetical protein
VWNCGCPDPQMPAAPGVQCAPQKTIADVLNNYYVRVSYDTVAGRNRINMAPKFSGSSVYSSTFSINRTTTNPDFARHFEYQESTDLVMDETTYALAYFGWPAPAEEVLKVEMRLGPRRILQTNTYMTSMDVLAQIGAFLTTVLMPIIGFLCSAEKKFYETHEAWSNVTGDFKVDLRPDEEVAREEAAKEAAANGSPGSTTDGGKEYRWA